MRKKLSLLVITVFALSLGACSPTNAPTSKENSSTSENSSAPISEPVVPSSEPIVPSSEPISSLIPSSQADEHTYMSVSEAVILANQVGEEGTAERQYVTGTVKSISNANYGEMYITDGTSDLYIYGVYSADGVKRYPELDEKPYTGDEVFLYGIVKTYKGNPEMGASWLQKMISHQGDVDLKDYQAKTILEARGGSKGDKVRITGVVAKINHANGMVPNGVYLVDDTSSIYVYSKEIAGRVEVGEEIEVAGTRDDYILDSEQKYAEQYGYQGAIQLADAIYIKSNGKGKDFKKSWIPTSSVKDMMDTPLSDNITSKIYKVNAIINKAAGQGFVNYYINDLDNKTGSYVYSMCNGSDFNYLDAFDGKICTVYLAIHNAKSTTSGIVYRLMPIDVEENKNFKMSDEEIINFALKYYAETQFLTKYNSDPELEVVTSISNEFIPFNNVSVNYESDNKELIDFANENDKLVMHVKEGNGMVNVTSKGTYNGKNSTRMTQIKVENIDLPETLTVAEAIDTEDNETVIVRGIVMSSVIVQTGFYLNDATGVIAVRTDKATIDQIELGQEVVIQGTRKHVVKEGSSNVGQSCIDNATLVANLMGNNNYDTSSFITDKTIDEICDEYSGDVAKTDRTTMVFVAKCYITKTGNQYSTNRYLGNESGSKKIMLYAGNASQFAAYDVFLESGEITVTFMLCDWNSKNPYKACIASATDGTTTVLNSYAFN